MIKEKEIKTYEKRLYCDKCGTEMKFTGQILCSYPEQYEYICENCGERVNEKETYPKTIYRYK